MNDLSGKVVKVSGPLVVATGLSDANMADVVRVGPQRLIGEILTMNGDAASIQVYEETSGLGPGAEVVTTGYPMSVELGPGMIEGIYDGIQRPLEKIVEKVGANITRGVEVPALDREKKWDFTAVVTPGTKVEGGDVIGTVPETPVVLHKIMVPPNMSGTITDIRSGSFTVEETVATLRIVKVFWALDSSLAYKRHFPALNWLNSYSLYLDSLKPWFDENLGPEFLEDRASAMSILQSEASLNEIVQLVGKDALSPADQLTLEVARMVREDFLQQNAFADVDSFSSYDRQEKLLAMVLRYDRLCREAISKGAPVAKLFAVPSREKIGRAKSVPAEEYQQVYQQISAEMEQEITAIAEEGGEDA